MAERMRGGDRRLESKPPGARSRQLAVLEWLSKKFSEDAKRIAERR